jgi:hypothetical protein
VARAEQVEQRAARAEQRAAAPGERPVAQVEQPAAPVEQPVARLDRAVPLGKRTPAARVERVAPPEPVVRVELPAKAAPTAVHTGTAGAAGTGGQVARVAVRIRALPTLTDCSNIATGMITVAGQQVQIWTGPANGRGRWCSIGTALGASKRTQSGLGPGFKIQTSGWCHCLVFRRS